MQDANVVVAVTVSILVSTSDHHVIRVLRAFCRANRHTHRLLCLDRRTGNAPEHNISFLVACTGRCLKYCESTSECSCSKRGSPKCGVLGILGNGLYSGCAEDLATRLPPPPPFTSALHLGDMNRNLRSASACTESVWSLHSDGPTQPQITFLRLPVQRSFVCP